MNKIGFSESSLSKTHNSGIKDNMESRVSGVQKNNSKTNVCGRKCEVYSRVCGYFRPVANWNKGKKEEFKDRLTYGGF